MSGAGTVTLATPVFALTPDSMSHIKSSQNEHNSITTMVSLIKEESESPIAAAAIVS